MKGVAPGWHVIRFASCARTFSQKKKMAEAAPPLRTWSVVCDALGGQMVREQKIGIVDF
jgi:hypothetical protein